MALRLEGSLITFLSVHLSVETSKFSNSQLMSDIGIPLKLLSSKNYEQIMISYHYMILKITILCFIT